MPKFYSIRLLTYIRVPPGYINIHGGGMNKGGSGEYMDKGKERRGIGRETVR